MLNNSSTAQKNTTQQQLEDMVRGLAQSLEVGFTDRTEEPEEGMEEPEPIMDFLETVLDIEWIVASDKQTLLGARLLVAFGGPNVTIDTRRQVVEGAWWLDSFSVGYCTTEGTEALDDALEMLWSC